MSNIGKKPSFEHIRTDEIVVRQGPSVALTAGTTTAALSGISGQSFVRLTVSGSSSNETVIAGITAPLSTEPARNGKIITLKNDSSVDIVFKEENASASADNRLLIGLSKEHTLSAGATICFAYDSNVSRWSLSNSSSEVVSSLVLDTNSVALTTSDLDLSTQPKKSSLLELTGTVGELRSITAGKVGELLMLVNKTGNILQVVNEDTIPSAGSRIITGTSGPVSIPNDASILLAYVTDSGSNSRWRIVGGTGSGGAATEQVAQTGIGILANFPVGTPLYVDATAWKKANAMAANTAEVAGLIGRRLNDNLAEVSLSGEITGITASAFVEAALPTRGSVVFLSTTDGKLTVSDITTIGYVSKPIGIVHNVNGTASVDVMFYNQRGVVVGSANARTQIALANGATTPVQDIAAYEAGELAGWVWINATTDYKFYFQTQFAKNGLGTDYNIAVPQTVGDVPPAGFSMDVLMGSGTATIRVTLPSLAGFVEAYVNYAINAPAVGTSLPLSVNSSSVYTNYKSVTGAYTLTSTDSLVVASGSSTYAVTLPTAVGAVGVSYTIKSEMSAGVNLTVNTTGGQLIDSATSRILLNGESIKVVSNGTKWINVLAPESFDNINVSSLTASRAVQTDANKNLVSAAISLPSTAGANLQLLSSNGDGTSSWQTLTIIKPTVSTNGTLDASVSDSFVHTGSGSRTITISNLADGQTINVQVQGANGNAINWTTTGLTQKTGITYSNTMTSVNSIYTFIRLGSNVFINSLHGFG